MADNKYFFLTKWTIKAPLTKVWNAIYESEEWPSWWKNVKEVTEIRKGDANGLGSIRVYKLRSPAHYTLRFELLLTERIDYHLLKGNASGDLAGTGAWYFREEAGLTYVECHWHVATNLGWMNFLSAVLRPAFSYNHALVMRQGAKALAKKLGAELISY